MHFSPRTKLANLLAAIPSAAAICQRHHIPLAGNEEKSLEKICAETGITVHSFMQELDTLDWERESPIQLKSS